MPDVSKEVQAKGLELIQKVNSAVAGSVFGVKETSDIVHLYFQGCELAESQGLDAVTTVLGLIAPIGIAYTGIKTVPAELGDLQDSEITSLINIGDSYKLGDNAVKYKQGLKPVLVLIQTFFVFKKKAS